MYKDKDELINERMDCRGWMCRKVGGWVAWKIVGIDGEYMDG
jgi:hypothetical protein